MARTTIIIAKDEIDSTEAVRVLGIVDKFYLTNAYWAKEFFTLSYANDYSGILYKEYWENPEFVQIFKIVYSNKFFRQGGSEAEKFLQAVQKSYRGEEKLCISFDDGTLESIVLGEDKPEYHSPYLPAGNNWTKIPLITSGATSNTYAIQPIQGNAVTSVYVDDCEDESNEFD